MGTSCVLSRTVFGRKWRYLIYSIKGLEPRLLPWQHYLAYITGAKFERHHSNVSRDSLGFVYSSFYGNDL